MVLEFERAQGMRHALDRVRLAMSEVICRVNAPFLSCARMLRVQDAVEHRVTQIDVAGRHVDLRPQHTRTVAELAVSHAAEQIEILVYRSVAVGAVAPGLRKAAP